MSITNYKVNGVDLFSGINGPTNPTGATGYNVNGTNLFTYYTSQGSNYQTNLSKLNYIYSGTPFDIMLYNYFSKASIGTPANAGFSNTNGHLCWKINNNTNVTFNFPNITTINFVAVGAGQKGKSIAGGAGGGVVRGQITTLATTAFTLSITIGGPGLNTSITCSNPSINITANVGPNSGSATGVSGTPIITVGGAGGPQYNSSGSPGPFISDLGIYVAGGGGAGDSSGSSSPAGGAGGGGTGGNLGGTGGPGQANTGGGGGGGGSGGNGGSGVVYLYLL